MNSINIKKKRTEQNIKVLVLGNGKRIVFKSKRVANAYIADTNRFLTKCLVTLNVAYADLFREYRIVWFTVTNFGCGPASNVKNEMQRVRDHLHAADQVLEKFAATAWGSNDPFFAFLDLGKIAGWLQAAGDLMAAYHKKRNTTANMYVCIILADRCASVKRKLLEYGSDL